VHLGLVFLLQTDSPDFSVQETELMTAQWASIDSLREQFPLMETWSQIVFENMIEVKNRRNEGAVPVQ
jgi:predicted NUDIX family phosphoesterase